MSEWSPRQKNGWCSLILDLATLKMSNIHPFAKWIPHEFWTRIRSKSLYCLIANPGSLFACDFKHIQSHYIRNVEIGRVRIRFRSTVTCVQRFHQIVYFCLIFFENRHDSHVCRNNKIIFWLFIIKNTPSISGSMCIHTFDRLFSHL